MRLTKEKLQKYAVRFFKEPIKGVVAKKQICDELILTETEFYEILSKMKARKILMEVDGLYSIYKEPTVVAGEINNKSVVNSVMSGGTDNLKMFCNKKHLFSLFNPGELLKYGDVIRRIQFDSEELFYFPDAVNLAEEIKKDKQQFSLIEPKITYAKPESNLSEKIIQILEGLTHPIQSGSLYALLKYSKLKATIDELVKDGIVKRVLGFVNGSCHPSTLIGLNKPELWRGYEQ